MSWIKKLIGCREEEWEDKYSELAEQFLPGILEDYYNNKYPKKDLTYRRTETDGEYQIDLRDFIHKYDASIPTVDGIDCNEKALKALSWVIKNIQYVQDISPKTYKSSEYWAYAYQTLRHKSGDCEDGAILLHNILLHSGVPYWKLRLTAGNVQVGKTLAGHAYLTFFDEVKDRWVILDWCYWPNELPITERPDYKDEANYKDVWFSWNEKYCYTQGLNTAARRMVYERK